jgi:hypothetical protein
MQSNKIINICIVSTQRGCHVKLVKQTSATVITPDTIRGKNEISCQNVGYVVAYCFIY